MRLHADHFIKSGDLSSARLLLERAAQAGDEDAALSLGGTFDPEVLKTLGLQDGYADIQVARLWYERAAKFGAAEARERLRRLAAAPAR
jgi:TPR repeat protein